MKLESKKVRLLVPVHHLDGTTKYEWQEVDGFEIDLGGVELKNGETLTLSYTTEDGASLNEPQN